MQDYTKYSIKDFILDESFCRWVIRNSTEDTLFWENWQKQHPQQAKTVLAAKELIKKIHDAHEELTETELKTALIRLSKSRDELSLHKSSYSTAKRLIGFAKLWKIAATVAIGIIALLYITTQLSVNPFRNSTVYEKRIENKKELLLEVINKGKSEMLVYLPDRSVIKLRANSRISYPKIFAGTNREVFLSGEAFFEVTKDPRKPFIVYANELITKVLGTSFTISSYDNDTEVKVIVKTGKVAVYSSEKEEGISTEQAELTLTPNQKAIFNRSAKQIERTLIELPDPVKPSGIKNNILVFENTPVYEVLDSLQEIYGITIKYDRALLSKCQLTAELENQPLYEKLTLICKAINATYEIKDGEIVINGSKCN
ncbi:ferric-dicitrate binding protein FerR, regulates iron transport through sigma-19 [Pseudarcicella hirudinis]|uniref:Ferric-dicitrate binding protein FerR, regulates iron transport through sigma-19 n=1 Tax=Pseudarcicella hirudinis TaxID=1079859 RepID=A0A1I5Y811_9BACT|nr:FecR domain-containing protein [Pseudarcicella hirudinis]SFQ40355.1 ferric-dicitrate binding protein FerR, regulates iron transport through sigma-19 [Pseudarcicella hirudinis]